MTTYSVPEEPDIEKVWSQDQNTGQAVPWRRAPDGYVHRWLTGDHMDNGLTWLELITMHGPIFDTHPDLAGSNDITFPLTYTLSGLIEDAHEDVVAKTENAAIGSLIVRAVNEYVKKRT